jgi:hypothetical protein
MVRNLALALLLMVCGLSRSSSAASPKCDGVGNYAASMAFVLMKNAGLLTNEGVDFTATSVALIASEKIGKDLYRQVHLVTYRLKSGTSVSAIAVNDASHSECSETGVKLYVVNTTL